MITTKEELVAIMETADKHKHHLKSMEVVVRGMASRFPSAIDNFDAARGIVTGKDPSKIPNEVAAQMLVDLCKDALFISACASTLTKLAKEYETKAQTALSLADVEVAKRFLVESGLNSIE